MRILNLKIIDPLGNVIRDIDFKKTGVSFVYGDIQEPQNKKATINSLGKTLLLKLLDYILGANEDSKIVKEDLHGYVLRAIVLFNSQEYVVTRILGDNKGIMIGNTMYTLTDYRTFFGIKRALYSKQILLEKKYTEISMRKNADKGDVVSCLKLLGLLDMIDDVEKIYASQDRIKDLKTQRKELISFYGNWDETEIVKEIYYIDKEVSRLQNEIRRVSEKIKDIEVAEIQQNVVEEYAEKGKKLKALKREYEAKRLECERLVEFIESSQKNDITSEHLLLIFEKVKQEIPEMVKRNLAEVEEFHRKVYEERKLFLGERKEALVKEMESLRGELDELSKKVDALGKIIATNEVYQESIELYGKYNSDLQELTYKQGKLSQVKETNDIITSESDNLTECFGKANLSRKAYDTLVSEYRDFIYGLIQDIYDEEVDSYFDIEVGKKHLTQRPVKFEFSIKGDTGEGVGEVKKILMDYLICKYNSEIEFLLQDSACYNGIDPRQIVGMLTAISEIAVETDKQVIIALNKYQLGGYDECIDYVVKNHAIILSEKDNLFGFDF
ncbi:MAG: DUF2326 domain-containing protein [Lachnospiraceae bacterium]|nr:DUF2326 domain-containing protein [Lachnospiraceae bacterium]